MTLIEKYKSLLPEFDKLAEELKDKREIFPVITCATEQGARFVIIGYEPWDKSEGEFVLGVDPGHADVANPPFPDITTSIGIIMAWTHLAGNDVFEVRGYDRGAPIDIPDIEEVHGKFDVSTMKVQKLGLALSA